MDRERLEAELAVFDGGADERRVVARQASDLAASGQLQRDLGMELTPEFLVDELRDAPEDDSLVDRWNWWMGSLELSQGGYAEFQVRRY